MKNFGFFDDFFSETCSDHAILGSLPLSYPPMLLTSVFMVSVVVSPVGASSSMVVVQTEWVLQSDVDDTDRPDAGQSDLESDADGAAENLSSAGFSELQSELQSAASSSSKPGGVTSRIKSDINNTSPSTVTTFIPASFDPQYSVPLATTGHLWPPPAGPLLGHSSRSSSQFRVRNPLFKQF